MESLYVLIPLSVGLVLALLAVFAWAVNGGQFDDLEAEGARILDETPGPVDADQPPIRAPIEQSQLVFEAKH